MIVKTNNTTQNKPAQNKSARKKSGKNHNINQTGGRNYSSCLITNNDNDINRINSFLKTYKQEIPKIIHQIWVGHKPIPWKWINSFKKDFISKYPDWKHYLWTEKEIAGFDMINNKAYLDCKSYAGKSDILRYELLYKYGGIYIDADTEWLGKDLNNLIKETHNGFFIGKEDKNRNVLANSVLGSSLHNPISKHLIDTLSKSYFKYSKLPPYKKSGPYFVDQALKGLDITVFPSYYFYPIYWHGKKSLNMSIEEQKKQFPDSYMTQFDVSTNNIDTSNL